MRIGSDDGYDPTAGTDLNSQAAMSEMVSPPIEALQPNYSPHQKSQTQASAQE